MYTFVAKHRPCFCCNPICVANMDPPSQKRAYFCLNALELGIKCWYLCSPGSGLFLPKSPQKGELRSIWGEMWLFCLQLEASCLQWSFFYLQLIILAFLLTVGAFLLTVLASLLAVGASLLTVEKCV